MKLYEGKEPCPGCGRTGIQVPRTYKSGLCYDCEQNLKLGKQIVNYYGREYKTPMCKKYTQTASQGRFFLRCSSRVVRYRLLPTKRLLPKKT